MNYNKIKETIEAIEASGKQYFEFASPVSLMMQHGYTKPDEVAMMVFEEAHRLGGIVLSPILRRLELQHLGVNCNGQDYWITKLEKKYEKNSVSLETQRTKENLEVSEFVSNTEI